MPTLNLAESTLDHDTEIDYSKYGFKVLKVNDEHGKETDFKAIYREKTNKYIAFVRDGYKLLPNEVVLEAGNEVADSLGLKPFKLITDAAESWKTYHHDKKYKYYKSKKEGRKLVQNVAGETHTLIDAEATRMFAFYTLPKLEMMDKGEEINFGICIRNSVDGSSGLNIDGFTFRHVCSNASLMTMIQVAKAGHTTGIRRRHTRNLQIGLNNLERWMEKVSLDMGKVKTLFGRWQVEQVNKDIIAKLGKSIPEKYLPDYISVEKNRGIFNGTVIPTSWTVYNDLTKSIWHEPVELKTKQVLFEKLHTSFGL
jgi:hypothetical protein